MATIHSKSTFGIHQLVDSGIDMGIHDDLDQFKRWSVH